MWSPATVRLVSDYSRPLVRSDLIASHCTTEARHYWLSASASVFGRMSRFTFGDTFGIGRMCYVTFGLLSVSAESEVFTFGRPLGHISVLTVSDHVGDLQSCLPFDGGTTWWMKCNISFERGRHHQTGCLFSIFTCSTAEILHLIQQLAHFVHQGCHSYMAPPDEQNAFFHSSWGATFKYVAYAVNMRV